MCGMEKSEMTAASATNASGSPSSVTTAAPTTAAASTAAPSTTGSCDVSASFGDSNINGRQIFFNYNYYIIFVICKNSVCQPDPYFHPGVTDVCKWICGASTC